MRIASLWLALLLLLLPPLEVFGGTRVRKDEVTLSYEELLALTSRQVETIASLRRENQQLKAQLAHGCAASPPRGPSRPRRLDSDEHPQHQKCLGEDEDGTMYIRLENQSAVEELGRHGCQTLFDEKKAGKLVIRQSVEHLRPLGSVKRIFGQIKITDTNLTSLEGLNNLTEVDGLTGNWPGRISITNTTLSNLDALQGLEGVRLLEIINNDNLATLPNLSSLTSVEGLKIQGNSRLVSLDGLHIEEVRGNVEISNNSMLESLAGLGDLKYVWANFRIQDNEKLKSLEGLGNLELAGAVKVFDNKNMDYLGGLFTNYCHLDRKMRWRSLEFVDEEGCHEQGAGDGDGASLISSYPRCVTPVEWDILSAVDYFKKDHSFVTPGQLLVKCNKTRDAKQANLDLWSKPNDTKAGACGPNAVECLWRQPCPVSFASLGIDYTGDVYIPECGSCGKYSRCPWRAVANRTIDINRNDTPATEPGSYPLCRCNSSMGPLLQIELRGPRIEKPSTTCQKGVECVVKGRFDAGAFLGSQIWLDADTGCSDPANSVVDGRFDQKEQNGSIVFPAQALTPQTVQLTEYTLCWKPEGDGYKGISMHKVEIEGPHKGETGERFPKEDGARLEIANAGIGVKSQNVMRLELTTSKSCNEEVHQINTTSVDGKFTFLASELRRGLYQKCWCDNHNAHCVHVGSVDVTCPMGLVESDAGTCDVCPLGWDFEGQINRPPICALEPLYWGIIGFQTLLLLWNFCLLLVTVGMPIRIQDTYTCSGLLYAASGYPHGFHMYGRKSFPVIFVGTKNRRLDSPKEPLRASCYMTQALRVLKANGEQVTECWDTSRGFLRLPWYLEFWHRGWPAPAGVLLVFNAILYVVLHTIPEGQDPIHLACGAAGALAIALILRVINRLYCKSSHLTGLDKRLDLYRGLLLKKNPKPVACEKGPGRAIPLSELYCLLEFFSAWIRERNAYYMDTNILGPLTAPYKLSYAELAGPTQVKWFVSHYWGNTFNDLCKTLRKHAELMTSARNSKTHGVDLWKDEARNSKTHGVDLWKDEAYWICFFSNNQYQLNDELGSGWDQSSFFLTLQSGYCQGVCLVLDTSAAPLTRAWCIFELLQTLLLEEKSTSCVKMEQCFKGLHLCTEGGVLNEGQGSAEVTINLVERICRLDLEKADASSAQDKEMIHMQVEKSLGSFKKMNAKVRQKFDDLLRRAKHQQDSSYCDVYQQLHAALKEDACFHDELGAHHPVKGMEVALELKNSGDALVLPDCSLRPPSGGYPGSGKDIRLEVPWPDPLNSTEVVHKQI